MEHRDKRPRLDNEEGLASTLEANAPSTEPSSVTAAMGDGSIATASSARTAASESVQDISISVTSDPAGTPDKATWQGWAEIENDPIVFNVMLREWGVQSIQVNEVVPLDTIFDSSPTSTYGLILLSRYSSTRKKQENIQIPQNLWFANQTSTFSCATVALMNILSNVENINLGPEVAQFVTATSDMSSKDRGLALDSFEHVRKVHNSFATIIDMKSVDHRLREDAKAFAQKQKQLARKTTAPKPAKATKKAKKQKAKTYILDDNDNEATDHEDTENGFHFIAYIPAQNHLWRMDGLRREPESLGTLSDKGNWLDMAVAELSAQWQSAAENNIEFSLLSLVAASDDEAARAKENVKAGRMREDWGPALAELVRIVAER